MIEIIPLSDEYIDILYKWENDEKLQRLTGENRKFSFTVFRELWYDLMEQCKRCYFIITEDKIPVGFCNIYNIDKKNGNAEIGYYIAYNDRRGRGVGKIFLSKLLNVAFSEKGLNKVYAKTFVNNRSNINFLRKFGFKKEGYLVKDRYENGKFEDIVIFGMLSDDFFAIVEKRKYVDL